MRATLRSIDPHQHDGWDGFTVAEIPEPWDHFEWFTVSIGPEGDPGADYFEVCVTTHAAMSRASKPRVGFRGVVVDTFAAEEVSQVLHRFVDSLSGHTWPDLVEQLRRVMRWEYEGMGGA